METEFVGEGFVRLDDCMADDMSVVNSARVSFAKNHISPEAELSEADKGLINFLMKNRHGTPFEHNSFRFHIKCPIFVAREWFRHRIGSFNEFSARYSEVPNSFYKPVVADIRTQVGKPGAYTFEPLYDSNIELATEAVRVIGEANDRAYATYLALLQMGVAKELARTVLPVGTFTQFYWTVNARALMNFLSLRLDENAQYEIRQYAQEVEKMFREEMPETWTAWVANERVAP